METARVGGPQPAQYGYGAEMRGLSSPADNSALLPEPQMGMDAMSQLYVLMSDSAQLSAKGSEEEIQAAAEKNEQLMKKFLDELKKALKAEKKGGFWGKLASGLSLGGSVFGTIAAVGLVVASGGAGAIALASVGAAMSLLAATEGRTGLLQKTFDLSDKQVAGLTAGLAIGGALLSFGGGMLTSAGSAGSLATDISTFAAVGAGVTSLGAGGAQITSAVYTKEAADHTINSTEIQAKQEKAQRLILSLIADLEETYESERANVGRFTDSIQTQGDTMLTAAQGV